MKYSRLRTFLLTLTFGIAVFSMSARLSGYLNEAPVEVPKIDIDVPKTDSETPLMIRVCPEDRRRQARGINCRQGGGGGG